MLKLLLQGVIDRAPQALEILERDVDLLKKYIAEPFKRVSYDEAIDLLQAHEMMKILITSTSNMEMTLVHHTKLGFQTILVFQHSLLIIQQASRPST